MKRRGSRHIGVVFSVSLAPPPPGANQRSWTGDAGLQTPPSCARKNATAELARQIRYSCGKDLDRWIARSKPTTPPEFALMLEQLYAPRPTTGQAPSRPRPKPATGHRATASTPRPNCIFAQNKAGHQRTDRAALTEHRQTGHDSANWCRHAPDAANSGRPPHYASRTGRDIYQRRQCASACAELGTAWTAAGWETDPACAADSCTPTRPPGATCTRRTDLELRPAADQRRPQAISNKLKPPIAPTARAIKRLGRTGPASTWGKSTAALRRRRLCTKPASPL